MFDTFFEKYPDYTIVQKPEQKDLDYFETRLPAELIEFWQEYGYGVFMDGYLKIINPSEYQQDFDAAYENTAQEIVFAATALGDFLTWTGDAIRAVYFKNGTDSIIESGDDMAWFFDMDLADEGFMKDNLSNKNYITARQRLGIPAYNECYGYTPLLGLGGAEKVENLHKIKIREHLSIIAQALGKIK